MRRKEILGAARKVFIEKGYARATIDEIAHAAGVAKGTVYLYFESKEDLFIALITKQMENITEISQRVNLPDPIERMIEFGREIAELDPPFHQILSYGQIPLSETFVKRMRMEMTKNFGKVVAVIAQWIEEGIKQKQFIKINPFNAAILFLALTRFIPAAKFFSDIEMNVDEILMVFLDGIKRR